MILDPQAFRKHLLDWYDRAHRMLPWRTPAANGRPDPWHILVSELMLQQTRVEAVIPYFHKFTKQFPDARSLAQAPDADALAAWSGLGYYSRIRNLQRAARIIANGFPDSYAAIRDLPGVGPYTAAAVASIGFDLQYAVADGNVFRVIARFTGDSGDIGSSTTRQRFLNAAQSLLDLERPGDFNQAMMELGATVCLPRSPLCLLCPVASGCKAREEGRQSELPVKRPKAAAGAETVNVVVVQHEGRILLTQRPLAERRMPGFWELPALAAVPAAESLVQAASFRHTIVNTRYTVQVWSGSMPVQPAGTSWFHRDQLTRIPLTTISKKALARVYPVGEIAAGASL